MLQAGKWFTILSHSMWLVLAVLSIYFFQERLYTDAAYYLFHNINSGGFHVELGRWVLGLSQLFPVLAIGLKSKLSTILISASVGHVLFHFGLFVLVWHYLKQPFLALSILLNQVIGISSGYFTPMFELYYAVSVGIVLLAWIQVPHRTRWYWPILILLACITLTGHPFATLLILFFIGLEAPQKWRSEWKTYLVLISLAILVFIIKTRTATPYEIGKSKAFLDTLKHGRYDFNYLAQLSQFLLTYYADWILLTWSTIGIFILHKKWWLGLISIFTFASVLCLVNVSNYGFEHTRYQEQVYFPLIALATFAASNYALPLLAHQTKTVVLVACSLLAMRAFIFIPESKRFEERIALMHSLINVAQANQAYKVIITPELGSTRNGIETNWSYGIESLLLSSAQGKSVSIITTEDVEFNNNRELEDYEFILRRWDIMPVQQLNKTYFNLPPLPYEPFVWLLPKD